MVKYQLVPSYSWKDAPVLKNSHDSHILWQPLRTMLLWVELVWAQVPENLSSSLCLVANPCMSSSTSTNFLNVFFCRKHSYRPLLCRVPLTVTQWTSSLPYSPLVETTELLLTQTAFTPKYIISLTTHTCVFKNIPNTLYWWNDWKLFSFIDNRSPLQYTDWATVKEFN